MMRVLAIGVAFAVMTGFSAETPKVDSPFDLELGSESFAARYPSALSRASIHGSSFVDGLRRSWTNWYLRATVDLARPYHLFTTAQLSFSDADKKLCRYGLNADCPEKMTRESCVEMLGKIVKDMNAHYGLKLKLEPVRLGEDDVQELKGKRHYAHSFIHSRRDDAESAASTNNVSVEVHGAVNGKGGMSVSVVVTESDIDLSGNAWPHRGRFFEGFKPRKPLTLPLGYSFGDVYTNGETMAVLPDCLTNWPTYYGQGNRRVPLAEKWRDFDCAIFYLTDFGRISSFAAVLSTNGVDSVEALENWAKGVLKARQDDFGIEFFGDLRFTRAFGATDDFRTVSVFCRVPPSLSRDSRKDWHTSMARADIRRMTDGRAFLRIAYSSDAARKLDEPQRRTEGAGVRTAVKELFGLDFEAESSNRSDWSSVSEWERLAAPKGPFTEWRPTYDDAGRLFAVRLRCVYAGDVTRETLSNAVRQVVRSIEAKAGVQIPLQEGRIVTAAQRKARAGEVLSPGDWVGDGFPTYEAAATVGDMNFGVSFVVPQYVKEGVAYRPILYGGFVFSISRELKVK